MTTTVRWTNESVLRFAGDMDPVAAITDRARQAVTQALDAGWAGPPFDPLAMAELLKLDVTAVADVSDARTVPLGVGQTRIEYNPNRPLGRMRYSVAHEIAHTFFPDCAVRVRHRQAHSNEHADDWQLEALCNIGAAEILMPVGSFGHISKTDLTVDRLLELRSTFHVSTEAMFIRAIKVATEASAMFCAHRIESGRDVNRFRVDYAIPSSGWDAPLRPGSLLSLDTVASQCTAIGYTAKGEEQLGGPSSVRVECVGIPPYPGSTYPRVVGLLLPRGRVAHLKPQIEYLRGNVLEPRSDGPHLIAHVVNNQTPTWGGRGVAMAIKHRWPEAQSDFRAWSRLRPLSRSLGEVCFSEVSPDVIVASIVAQVGYGPSERRRIRYNALRAGLAEVADYASRGGSSIHIPRLGCGQAGGSWHIVQDLVADAFLPRQIPVTVYDPPD